MLTLALVCVGRIKAGAERDLAERYIERAKLAGRSLGLAVNVRELVESPARRPDDRRIEESQAIRAAVPIGASILALDERGGSMTSPALAAVMRTALDAGVPLAIVIGGPDGLDAGLRGEAAHVIALGAMTWPHQLVRIMAAEQIYRSLTILSGHPYHRA